MSKKATDLEKEFERQDITCSVCKRTKRLAVWKRLVKELGVPITMARIKRETKYLCPICGLAGKEL